MSPIEILENGSTIAEIDESEEEKFENSPVYKIAYFRGQDYLCKKDILSKEKYVASFLSQNNTISRAVFSENEINSYIKEYETQNNITLADEQKEGVHTLLFNRIAILTGGPGTGKTSVTKCILYCILRHFNATDISIMDPRFPFVLFAPTGKAARRMTEATGFPATTILKGLEYNPYRGTVKSLRDHYILVDESSMIDVETMYALCKSLEGNGRFHLYFIGDTEQLPSVGEGSVLRDLISSQMFPVNALVKTFRQKEGSTLLENIDIIKKGCNCSLVEGADFVQIENINDFLPVYYKTIAEVGYKNVVVLTPNRRVGANCSNNLNKLIQSQINQRKGFEATIKRDGKTNHISFRYGDPVIQLVNREVANGDVGVVIFADENKVVVEFSTGQKITYGHKTINQLDLAYAISIHKSQGSEYPIAFVLCDKSRILDRNMIYTAVTRAKKKCFLFGNSEFISEACKKQSTWERTTALIHSLQEEQVMKIVRMGKR